MEGTDNYLKTHKRDKRNLAKHSILIHRKDAREKITPSFYELALQYNLSHWPPLNTWDEAKHPKRTFWGESCYVLSYRTSFFFHVPGGPCLTCAGETGSISLILPSAMKKKTLPTLFKFHLFQSCCIPSEALSGVCDTTMLAFPR